MARKTRVHYYGSVHHVIVRGNNKEFIFREPLSKEIYREKVLKYVEKYNAKLYAYVIMDNHAHLLIGVSDIALSKVMQLVQQTYTQRYNKVNNRSGHVFEQRYKSIICDTNEYMLTVIKYIHLNPVRAGIGDIYYKWSSHNDYIRGKSRVCDIDTPLKIFANIKSEAISKYRIYVEHDDLEIEDIYSYSPLTIMLKHKDSECHDIQDFTSFVKNYEKDYNVSVKEFKGRSSNKTISIQKQRFVYEVINQNIVNQKVLAEYLEVSQQSICKIVNKMNIL